MKNETIKWLTWHINEINNNALAQNIPKEDKIQNEKMKKEISECIKWVKKQK